MGVLNIILNILLFILIFQLCTISHELGHAIPLLIFTREKVCIILGFGDREIKTLLFSRLEIKIRRFNPIKGYVWRYAEKINRLEEVIAYMGGPVVSLFIGIVFLIIGKSMMESLMGQVLTASAYIHFYQFICTALPIKYPKFWGSYSGQYSDGYNVGLLIKSN